MKIKIIFATLAIALNGCSTEPDPMPEPALKTLNKAKGMEQQLQDAEAERKKKMDEQEKTDNGTE